MGRMGPLERLEDMHMRQSLALVTLVGSHSDCGGGLV